MHRLFPAALAVAVGVVLISIALTGFLVWMQGRAIKTSGSMAVEADRAHYAADLAAKVAGVDKAEITLTPGWATKLPSIAGHVHVVVKVAPKS